MSRLFFLIKFSWRNLGRQPWRSIIMGLGLAFGTGYMMFALNFAHSGSQEIIHDFLSQYFGAHQIVAKRYYPEHDKKRFDPRWTVSDHDVASLPPTTYVRRVTLPIFLSGPRKTLGTLLSGIEIEKEKSLSQLKRALVKGQFLHPQGVRELLLGERLARKAGVQVGDEVAVIGQALDGSMANDMFKVVGLLSFGGGDMEDALAFTQISDAQIFGVIPPERFHQYVNFGKTQASLPNLSGVAVVPWTSIVPEIHRAVEFTDIFNWIITSVMVLIINLGLANTLMITFLEREKEFLALNIIGARSSWIAYSLMIEVALLGISGIGLGIFLGLGLTTYFHHNPFDLTLFTGGKPLMVGGIAMIPRVRLSINHAYTWQVPLTVASFLCLSLVWPLVRVLQRSRRAD